MTERRDDSSSWARQWEIFHAALERPAAERAAFLAEECPEEELRREVEELLASHEAAAGPLDRPVDLSTDAPLGDHPSRQVTLLRETLPTLPPGTLLVDRFEIVRLLGQGGMGSVYEAQDRTLDTRVALKMLRSEISRSTSANQRFRREIQLARQVTHPNVCRLFDLFQDASGESFLSMELLGGQNLAEHLQREGALEPDEALPIVRQIAAALGAAHNVGVVHRDLKSANVMLDSDGEDIRAVVTDFGLATSTGSGDKSLQNLTQTGQILGTPAFMAPEQLEGGEITSATDIYAFGIVMYEMLTGELPFEGATPFSIAAHRLRDEAPSPRRHLPDLDRNWERTILRCLERDPQDRFASVEAITSSLESDTVSLPPTRKIRRNRKLGWAALGLVLAAAVFLAWPRLMELMVPSQGVESTPADTVSSGIEDRVWVLFSSFDNRTELELSDGVVESALARELTKASRVSLVPKQRVREALQRMKRAPDTKLDADVAREVALRDGNVGVVLESRMEQLGQAYAIIVEISGSTEESPLATIIEEAVGKSEVPAAIQRLAIKTREALDDSATEISSVEPQLAKVTTASMKALELFTEAEAAQMSGTSWMAEGLYKRAIEVDPEFASGYTFLAYNLHWNGRPHDECLRNAERGVELIDGTSDTERLLILGAYDEMSGDDEKARAAFGSLLRLQPDHYWGLTKLADHYRRSGRQDGMTRFWVQAAELRPDYYKYNAKAAWYLAAFQGRLDEAEPFSQRALELSTEYEGRRAPEVTEFLSLFPFHRAWMDHDLDSALTELDVLGRKASELRGEERTNQVWLVGAGYAYLGMITRAEEFNLKMATSSYEQGQWNRRSMRGLQLARLDEDQWVDVLEGNFIPSLGVAEVIRLALAGMLTEARELLESLEPVETWDELGLAKRRAAEGMLTLAEGNPVLAIPLLQEAVDVWRYAYLGGSFFRTCQALAQAHELNGRVENAFAVLEDASQQRPRAIYGKGGWIDMRFYTAELHRKYGREAAALEVEAELRTLLRLADLDTRWARELERLSQSTAQQVTPK